MYINASKFNVDEQSISIFSEFHNAFVMAAQRVQAKAKFNYFNSAGKYNYYLD